MARLSIILPTYNERENIVPLLERIDASVQALGADCEILVVDDASPDGTARLAEQYSGRVPVRVLVRDGKRGLARSVLEGFRAAKGEYLIVMDADLSHPPESIPGMWDEMHRQAYDLVVGSRYVPGAVIQDWSRLRKLCSRVSRLLVRPITRVQDPLSGFFLVRREVIAGSTIHPRGFKILLEILARGRYRKVGEVPVPFRARARGQSKLSGTVTLVFLLQVVELYALRAASCLRGRCRRP